MRVTEDLKRYPRVLHPVVAPFLKSYQQIRKRFAQARKLLEPLFTARMQGKAKDHLDMVQWLVDSAKGQDREMDKLVLRMLFLNMAAIHTTAETTTNVLFELCARPEYITILREEMESAIKEHKGISQPTLASLKKTDSFIKESHRMNSMGFRTCFVLLTMKCDPTDF
jgi:cytochrome P450